MKTIPVVILFAGLLATMPLAAQPPTPTREPPAGVPMRNSNETPPAEPPLAVDPAGMRVVAETDAQGNVHYRILTSDGKSVRAVQGFPGMAPHYRPSVSFTGKDPEAQKLFEAESQAALESMQLARELRTAADEKQKPELKARLKEALEKQFDAQQKRRSLEVTKIEERLSKLKDTMKKRETAKETIVGRRLDELTGVTDELGWEDTIEPQLYRNPYRDPGNIYTLPVPIAPPAAYPSVPAPMPPRTPNVPR